MANRPIFLPGTTGCSLSEEHSIEFTWYPGLSVSQKQKSVASLHEAASKTLKINRILEVSTKSLDIVGKRLSAFNLQIKLTDGSSTSVEAAYQSSKKFINAGPFVELLHADPRSAKTDERLRNSGVVKEFEFDGTPWPTQPLTAFYDWLYITALSNDLLLCKEVTGYEGFTDIEFNPERSVNCQARAIALFCGLHNNETIYEALKSRDNFIEAIGRKRHRLKQSVLFD